MAKNTKSKTAKAIPADPWQAEDDMRTLMRAEEIKSDCKRCRRAKVAAKKQMKAVSKVAK